MSDEEEIYCICRSSDVSRFMIACDHCEEWYHGDCINVTEEEATVIRKFYCKTCRSKNPGLQIKYKAKKVENSESKEKQFKEKVKDEKPKEKIKNKTFSFENFKDKKEEKAKDGKHKEDKIKLKEKSKEKLKHKYDMHKDKFKEIKPLEKPREEKPSKEKPKDKIKEPKPKDVHQKIEKSKSKSVEDKYKEKRKEDKSKDESHSKEKLHKEKDKKDSKEKHTSHSKNKTFSGSTLTSGTSKQNSKALSITSNHSNSTDKVISSTKVSTSKISDGNKDTKASASHSIGTSVSSNKEGTIFSSISSSKSTVINNKEGSSKTVFTSITPTPNKINPIKKLSIDLSDVSLSGNRCFQCEPCRLTVNCGVCEACHKRSNDSTCIKRRCKNLHQLNKQSSKDSSKSTPMDWEDSYPSTTPPHTPIAKSSSSSVVSATPKPTFNSSVKSSSLTSVNNNTTPKTSSLTQSVVSSKTPFNNCNKSLPKPIPNLPKVPATLPSLIYSSDESDDNRPRSVLKDRNEMYSDDDVWEPTKKKSLESKVDKKSKEKPNKNKMKKLQKKISAPRSAGKKRKGCPDSGSSDSEQDVPFGGRYQCQGPGCVKAARPRSKYCCQECGLKLAEKRIFAILPQRIQEWKLSGCVAESQDTKKLEKIRSQQLQAQAELQKLDARYQKLEETVERGLKETVDPQADEGIEEEGVGEGAGICCVTCGHEIPTRRAIRHMENCFNKLESQTSFGSHYKTKIEGNTMFCDFYSASTRTYCKRLRVMCPEHYKEPKVPETRVCGAPLVKDVFTETGELCRASRKRCIRHYRWERLRKAEIDMERVRQWMKLDELLEHERQVRASMTNRAGVLGLMLHSAYDHTLATRFEQQLKLQKQQELQRQQQQKEQKERQEQQQRVHQPQKIILHKVKLKLQQPESGNNKVLPSQGDHKYFQQTSKSSILTNKEKETPKPQQSDHQYFRLNTTLQSAPGPIKLKIPQKTIGGGPQRTVIQLQKGSGTILASQPPRFITPSGATPRYLQSQQQQPQPPTSLSVSVIKPAIAGGARFHPDVQPSAGGEQPVQPNSTVQLRTITVHRPAPQQQRSDHVYFAKTNNK